MSAPGGSVQSWPDLRPAERLLVEHSSAGTTCDVTGNPTDQRVVRAGLLYELCVDSALTVHAKGVHLVGARVEGPLDLEYAALRVPLTLVDCSVDEDLTLRGATASAVQLLACRIGGVLDAALLSAGRLALSRSTLSSCLLLSGAAIDQNLELDGASLFGAGDPGRGALLGDGMRVGGGVYMGDGFRAHGSIRLISAVVGGNLELTGAALRSTDGVPLVADGIRIGGAVFCNDGFEAAGVVRFAGALIDGQLCFDGASLTASDASGNALVADGCRVGGDAFLRGGFTAAGAVAFTGATVRGSLELDGALVTGIDAEGEAFLADGLTVGGDAFLRDGFDAAGAVRLAGATVGGVLELDGARVRAGDPDGNALVGDRMRVGGGVFLGNGFEAAGAVRLHGATIDGQLSLSGARVTGANADGDALVGDGLTVGSDTLLHGGFRTAGAVRMAGAVVGGSLVLDGARLDGADARGDALVANKIYVAGDASLRQGFETSGTVRLAGATIAGRLSLEAGTCGGLVLTGARCSELSDDEASWPASGGLVLRGFRFENLEGETGWKERLSWVRRQGLADWSPDPYEQLAQFYASVGDEDAANRVRIAKDDDELAHLRLTRRRSALAYRFWRRPFGWLVGYGYRRNRAGWLLVGMILAAALVFRGAETDGAMVPSQPVADADGALAPCGSAYPCFNSFVYGADVVLPIIDFGQDTAWRPAAIEDRHVRWVWARWVFVAVGWALASIFVAAFTGLVHRR